MNRKIYLLFVLLSPGVCFGVQNELIRKTIDRKVTAEVEPGKFIDYQEHIEIWDLKHTSFAEVHAYNPPKQEFFQRDTTYLSIPWQGKNVLWVGFGVPICLRSHNNQIYLVVFDRDTDFSKTRFRYFRKDHTTLAEITAAAFPKEIAVQNLWLKKNNGFRDNGKPVNPIEIAKNLNPEDIDFQQSLTAMMWMHLETGKEYYEIQNERVPAEFLKDFLKKHNVKKLQVIVKE